MASTQGVRLDKEIQVRLKSLGSIKDRSMNHLIREAVLRYLVDEERFEREKNEDEERLQHFLDTGEHVSHDYMKAKLKVLMAKAVKVAS